MKKLRAKDSVSARALEFTILTAARTGDTIGGKHKEINKADKLWTVPATRMKGKKGDALDYFVHGIARIDTLGPNRRLVFTIPSLECPDAQTIVVKVIMTAELLATLSYMAASAGAVPANISPELLALETTTAN